MHPHGYLTVLIISFLYTLIFNFYRSPFYHTVVIFPNLLRKEKPTYICKLSYWSSYCKSFISTLCFLPLFFLILTQRNEYAVFFLLYSKSYPRLKFRRIILFFHFFFFTSLPAPTHCCILVSGWTLPINQDSNTQIGQNQVSNTHYRIQP